MISATRWIEHPIACAISSRVQPSPCRFITFRCLAPRRRENSFLKSVRTSHRCTALHCSSMDAAAHRGALRTICFCADLTTRPMLANTRPRTSPSRLIRARALRTILKMPAKAISSSSSRPKSHFTASDLALSWTNGNQRLQNSSVGDRVGLVHSTKSFKPPSQKQKSYNLSPVLFFSCDNFSLVRENVLFKVAVSLRRSKMEGISNGPMGTLSGRCERKDILPRFQ